jgi:hypothetical protein
MTSGFFSRHLGVRENIWIWATSWARGSVIVFAKAAFIEHLLCASHCLSKQFPH